MEFDGLVEDEADDLGAGEGRSPAGGYSLAECVLDGEEVIFRGDLNVGDGFEIEPWARFGGRSVLRMNEGLAHLSTPVS